MPRDKRKVEDGLVNKGFMLREGDHHRYIYHTLQGKKSDVHTKTSHTPKMKELGDNLLGQMAIQCKLTKSEFFNLLDCPLSREEYEVILQRKGKR